MYSDTLKNNKPIIDAYKKMKKQPPKEPETKQPEPQKTDGSV